jgi:urease beta subunit
MAVSIETKVDLLLKKLSGVTKTDTPVNKSVSNEVIASPSLNRGDRIWLNSYLIPTTANPTLGTVESYFQNNRVECVPDTTSQKVSNVYPTWKTNLTDWIPPEFDSVNIVNSYRVKVFYGESGIVDPTASISNQQIFADGNLGVGEWNFDYQAGVLNFYGGTIPSNMNSSHVIYILGFRYVGPTGFNSVFKVDTPIMRGNLLLPTLITLRGDTVIEKNVVIKEDLEIQGGDITTNQTVFNLLNTQALTVNFAREATNIQIGSSDGITNINNNLDVDGNLNIGRDLDVDGDVNIDGQDLKTTSTTFNLLPDTAQIVNFATAATDLVIGATSGTTQIRNSLDVDGDVNVDGDFHIGKDLDVDGDLNIDGGDLTVSTSIFNLANATATTINFGGAATVIEIGSSQGSTNINNNLDVDGDVNIDGQDLKTTSTSFNLLPDTAQTVNFATAATDLVVGATSGTTQIRNSLDVDGDVNIDGDFHIGRNVDVDGDLNIDGGDLTVSTAQFNLVNENATTINFGGAATIIEIGSQEGITNVNNNLDIDGDVNIDGGDLTVSTETFNLANTTAKTVNFAGQATNIEIGSKEGDTSVNNNLRVDGIVDVNNSLYVEGQARVSRSLEVEDSVKVQRELEVEGDTQITRDLSVGGYIKAGMLVDTMIDCGEY